MKKLFITLLLLMALCLPAEANEKFDLTYSFSGGYARFVRDLKWGLVDENLEEILIPKWDYLGEVKEDFRLIRSGTLVGFSDKHGQVVIAPQFVQATNFSEGFAGVQNEEGKWGFIDKSGVLCIPFAYEEANPFTEGLALVKQNGLYGYINAENQAVIPPAYCEAYPFSEGLACVKEEDVYGYIDKAGNMVIPAQFELAFDFCEGCAVIKKGGYGLINTTGKPLIAPHWEQLSPQVNNGLLKARQNGKLGFIDTAGTAKTDFIYVDLGDFSEGFCPAATQDGYGYLNAHFKLSLPAVWEQAGAFSEKIAPVKKDGLSGYINTNGDLVNDCQFQEAGPIIAGYGTVCLPDGSWQFIRPEAFTVNQPAEEPNDEIVLVPNTMLLEIGNPLLYTENGTVTLDVAPTIYNGYTLLPIRAVIEAMGGTVEWDAGEGKITLKRNGHVVMLRPGETAAFVDGRITLLEAMPVIENERTLSPLRFAAEALECGVSWDEKTSRIVISY